MMKAVRMAGSIATPIRPRILPHYVRHYCPFSSMPTPALQKDAEYCRSLKRGLSLLHASLRPSGLFTQGYRPCYVRLGRLPRNCRAMSSATDIETSVGLLVEGNPKIDNTELNTLVEQLYEDAGLALQQATVVAMGILEGDEDSVVPGPLELSVVLCDDAHIQELNKEWRGIDSPTDVLSFEMGGDFDFEDDDEFLDDIQGEAELDNEEDVVVEDYEDDVRSEKLYEEAAAELDDDASNVTVSTDPAMILGDVVISIDTAKKQAEARGYTLRDECRILLIHGILHLLGYDHEHGMCTAMVFLIFFKFLFLKHNYFFDYPIPPSIIRINADIDEEAEMAAAESKILGNLGWAGSGLIAAAGGGS